MIIAIVNQAGANGRGVANNLAVLRTRSGRKVLLIDTDPKKPSCTWSNERGMAGIRPWIPARALGGGKASSELENLIPNYNDIVIDTAGNETGESRTALIAARLAIVAVDAGHIDLADQYKLITRLNAARNFNPGLRVLFVIVGDRDDPTGEALASIRAYVSRVMAATLAATVIHAPASFVYGQGRCVCDAETCDPDIAAEFQALYREVYAQHEKPLP